MCSFHASPRQDTSPGDWTPSPRVHSDPPRAPATENGPAESYFALQQQQQLGGFQSVEHPKLPEPGAESETTLSPSPAPSPAPSLDADLDADLDTDLDLPVETDIDDFQEDDGTPAEGEPITSELPCLALPVTVLETDIDTLADTEGTPVAVAAAEGGGSLEEEPEGGAGGREGLSLEELFPHSGEGEAGPESWRGAEHNTDSLDRYGLIRTVSSSVV